MLTRIEQQGESSRYIYFLVENLQLVVSCQWKFFVNSEWRSTYSEQRELTMRQVVAFRRIKTMRNEINVRHKKLSRTLIRGRSFTTDSSCKTEGKVWHGVLDRWSYMKVPLYLLPQVISMPKPKKQWTLHSAPFFLFIQTCSYFFFSI